MSSLEPELRELLDWFVERDAPWAGTAREALRDTQVLGVCGCGCGTLRLRVADSVDVSSLPRPLPVEGLAPTPVGVVNVQLWIEPSRALLELVWTPEPAQPPLAPRAAELELAPWSRR
jgi:hypothetical protein